MNYTECILKLQAVIYNLLCTAVIVGHSLQSLTKENVVINAPANSRFTQSSFGNLIILLLLSLTDWIYFPVKKNIIPSAVINNTLNKVIYCVKVKDLGTG